jgi:hypothetical protein
VDDAGIRCLIPEKRRDRLTYSVKMVREISSTGDVSSCASENRQLRKHTALIIIM